MDSAGPEEKNDPTALVRSGLRQHQRRGSGQLLDTRLLVSSGSPSASKISAEGSEDVPVRDLIGMLHAPTKPKEIGRWRSSAHRSSAQKS